MRTHIHIHPNSESQNMVANQESLVAVLAGKMWTHARLVAVKWKAEPWEHRGGNGIGKWQLATGNRCTGKCARVCMCVHTLRRALI